MFPWLFLGLAYASSISEQNKKLKDELEEIKKNDNQKYSNQNNNQDKSYGH